MYKIFKFVRLNLTSANEKQDKNAIQLNGNKRWPKNKSSRRLGTQ